MNHSNLSRRHFLELMAATALGEAACSGPPAETIVPFVLPPEEGLPGEPLFYATACSLSGYAMGVLVENNEGRPTKVEGNPAHPASLGATDVFAQAALWQMWDPSRSRSPLRKGLPASHDEVAADIAANARNWRQADGEGLALLTGNVCSDTLAAQIGALRSRYPRMSWHCHDPLRAAAITQGSRLAFGRELDTIYHFDRARCVVSLDADFLYGGPASVRHAHDFAQRRDPGRSDMSRIYALESMPGLAGAAADERLALPPDAIERFVYQLAASFGIGPGAGGQSPLPQRMLRALVSDLRRAPGASLIVPGDGLSASAHALVHALNQRLGADGSTRDLIAPVAEGGEESSGIGELAARIRDGAVRWLVVLGGNPAYDSPADLQLDALLADVPWSMHLSVEVNETSRRCGWHVPQAHEFESWSDQRAFDGTASIVQPLIAPLYGGRTAHEILGMALGETAPSAHRLVREHWMRGRGHAADAASGGFEEFWRESLRTGVIAGTARAAIRAEAGPMQLAPPPVARESLTVLFRPDAAVRDGQFANNAWLQELPRPLSKLTWENAAYMAPRTASANGIASGDEIEIGTSRGRVRAPAWVLPGHAEDCVTLPLGYGRRDAGPVGRDLGFNAYALRESSSPWRAAATAFSATGVHRTLASTQTHARMQGRDIVRWEKLGHFRRHPDFATDEPAERVPEESLYPDHPYDGYKWGMSIDLNRCIGCNACVAACQAENNIPVVGKEQVALGREMHWLRVDRYYEQDDSTDRTHFQPVPCMHCERAPCELVCPVDATLHDSQGLNLQVYNRCVGTRFCSQNCPYKVRRFNFLHYADPQEESLKAMQNPEVTVRERGVMEKCTYCVQRITRARTEADRLDRSVKDGEVVTACQAACPTQAIVFGDMNDPQSGVSGQKRSPRRYALLAELNTRPRTTYLARVVNDADAADEDGDDD